VTICALGIFISIPFAPPTDSFRMRPYAASIAMISVLPALGLWSIINKTKLKTFKHVNTDRSLPFLTICFTTALVITVLIGSSVVKYTGSQKTIPASVCNSSLSHVFIRINQGASVSLVKNTANISDWPPNYHTAIFRRQAHSIEDGNLINWTETIPPSNTILATLDLATMSNVLIVLPTKSLPKPGEYKQLCGNYEKDPSLGRYKIFYAE
jgi:hypothetical protein